MAATQTVPQVLQSHKSLSPHFGVVTLFGYGTTVRVERGHLILEDGIGSDRRYARLSRVGHGLKRLVVIGSDGMISFAALRWLADQDAAFVMLERDGSVLATTGPVRPSDARLRRAQSLASRNYLAVEIAKELIDQKLAKQEALARDALLDSKAAEKIASARTALRDAPTVANVRYLEAQAGLAYWSAWRSVPVLFPRGDLRHVPAHWQSFGARISPLTHSPRLAVNPPNAILNYLYAILEAEARLAIAALGLDPGLGFLHFDSRTRDSLACDVMEPVRPQVDAYLLQWLRGKALQKEWFFEQRDGNCRLMGTFAARLSETAPAWSRAVAPLAEWVARTLWKTLSKPARRHAPATRLTQQHRRQVKGGVSVPIKPPPRPPTVCRICGTQIRFGRNYCPSCNLTIAREGMIEAAKLGRILGHGPEARARQAEKQRRHAAEVKKWEQLHKLNWLTEEVYRAKILPCLSTITVPAISSALGISGPYAAHVRRGKHIPHPRHWQALARLIGLSGIS
jgi:CRISPR-associated endonuclease Cas1